MNRLGLITNPYNQNINQNFGYNPDPSPQINRLQTQKGNQLLSLNPGLAKQQSVNIPQTLTKAGISDNIPPEQLPKNLVNIKFPQRSSATHAIIEQDRVGVQLGAYDMYRDNPHQDWTYGIQYYTIYQGSNPKTSITPVMTPPIFEPDVWAQDNVTFQQINKESTVDITDLNMEYTCKKCNIPSASLGTPVKYQSKNPTAPLPVQPPGAFPQIGQYTTRSIGHSIYDPYYNINPIMELQYRKNNIKTPEIQQDYDNNMLNNLKNGFSFE